MRAIVSVAASLAVATIGLNIQVSLASAQIRSQTVPGACTVTVVGKGQLNLWCKGTDGKLNFSGDKPMLVKESDSDYPFWVTRVGLVTQCGLTLSTRENPHGTKCPENK
jgi:hypothetical protein